ncbi:MAG: hypothetical protein OWT27_07175 [Firmicutes bacterium]|nr:hypothetical protein [Bacillota bacterium]
MTESAARHGLFALLLLYTLAGMDLMSASGEAKSRALQGWVGWGTAFVLIGFFVLPAEPSPAPPNRAVLQGR